MRNGSAFAREGVIVNVPNQRLVLHLEAKSVQSIMYINSLIQSVKHPHTGGRNPRTHKFLGSSTKFTNKIVRYAKSVTKPVFKVGGAAEGEKAWDAFARPCLIFYEAETETKYRQGIQIL